MGFFENRRARRFLEEYDSAVSYGAAELKEGRLVEAQSTFTRARDLAESYGDSLRSTEAAALVCNIEFRFIREDLTSGKARRAKLQFNDTFQMASKYRVMGGVRNELMAIDEILNNGLPQIGAPLFHEAMRIGGGYLAIGDMRTALRNFQDARRIAIEYDLGSGSIQEAQGQLDNERLIEFIRKESLRPPEPRSMSSLERQRFNEDRDRRRWEEIADRASRWQEKTLRERYGRV